ncbi:MAG: tetratricopeptide repeat protein [Bacteroidetes bacterium]|nr:tetratricopeptide repeat protein [Bacteroidota bacterium]
MKKITTLLICVFALSITGLRAQLSPYYEFQHLYEEASELFEKNKYGAAQKKIDGFLQAEKNLRSDEIDNDLHANARFLQALCAYHLDRNDAVALIEKYIADFDENTKVDLMRYYLGKYYFIRKRYDMAIGPLEEAYVSGRMSMEKLTELTFLLGYASYPKGDGDGKYIRDNFYTKERLGQAIKYFTEVSKTQNPYTEDALYYRAILLYESGQYEEAYYALKDLNSTSQKYGEETKVYLANSLLKLKKYDELYILADELITGPRVQNKDAQIYYIVANASFEKYDYPKSTEFFGKYEQGKGKLNRTDYFRYGYSYYKQQNYKSAIPLFQKSLVRLQTDSLTQLASYYLGFCYLEEKDEDNAKVAFQKATMSDQNGNPVIAEDALFQLGKVSFSTGDYANATKALAEFSQKYPNSRNIEEVQTMIGETYLYSRDYASSVKYFESVPRTNNRAKSAYQTVAFYYGLQLFEGGKYKDAATYFSKAIQNSFDRNLALSAQYWLGETHFRGENYSNAVSEFNNFIRQPNSTSNEYYDKAFLGLGWAYFKQKNYDAAFQNFDLFLKKTNKTQDKNLIVDAYLRAGDCKFLQKNYSTANKYYQEVINMRFTQGAYAYYQLGESNYRLNNYQAAVTNFDNLINTFKKSELRDDALDRISEIYVTWIKNNAQAIKYGKMLVDEYPKSPLAADAYNRMALASYNSGDSFSAVKYFKKVISDFSGDKKNAQIALDNLAGLVTEAEFDKILAEYRGKNPNMDTNLATLVFNTGRDRFFAGNYSSAIEQFTVYINDYKNGPDYFEALLFRARANRELAKFSESLDDYRLIYSATGSNEFTNTALQEAAEIKYDQKDYVGSLQLYQNLDLASGKLDNKVVAKFGIAKNHKALQKYGLARNVLTEIKDNNEVAIYSRTKAQVEIGHCFYLEGNLASAKAAFAIVEKDFKNEEGAESQYMITRILFDEGMKFKQQGKPDLAKGKFEEVKSATIYMANNFSSYNYEKAKTFLVAAQAYYEMGNVFQAKGTLESLISDAPYPDVKAEAEIILAKIEAAEKQEP